MGREKAMTALNDPEVKAAVSELMGRLGEAWERGDGQAYGSLFAEDAQYVTAPGERLLGREPIADSHQRIFDTIFQGTKLGRGYPVTYRSITPEVVLVEGSGAVLFPGEREQDVPPNGLMTMVVAKQRDGWRIVSFQNTPTGSWRMVKFFWRYVVSRFSASSRRSSLRRS
jgi:uncharacterized protein (TIGR02246 family)